MKKSHYRKVFKSDHLGTPDLEEFAEEGKGMIYTIKYVTQFVLDPAINGSGVTVAGKRIGANIAYFKEEIKPLVLNSTNSKQVAKFTGSKFVDDWNNVLIELYIDSNVKMKGQVVGGVRIRPTQPQLTKTELTPTHSRWADAKKAVKEGKEKGVLAQFTISDVNLELLRNDIS